MEVIRYTYISDTQLDMLISQIRTPMFRRIANELQISLNVVSVSLRRSPNEDNRYARLRIASDYIRKKAAVGTLNIYPLRPWLIDQMPLSSVYAGDDAVLYFGSRGRARICLLGSRRSIVGAHPAIVDPTRGTGLIIEQLLAHSWNVPPDLNEAGPTVDRARESLTLELIDHMMGDVRGVPRSMRFAAYTVMSKARQDGVDVLACPLYLAEG